MIHSFRVDQSGSVAMEEHDVAQRRRMRKHRIDRVKSRGGTKTFFGSSYAALICMLVALGSIIAYWRDVPLWVYLALGMGAVLIIAGTGFFLKSNRRTPQQIQVEPGTSPKDSPSQ